MTNKKLIIKTIAVLTILLLTISCTATNYAEADQIIISAKIAMEKIDAGYTILDAQKKSSYAKEHLIGAVNIERASINIKVPVPNTVATGDIIAKVAGDVGLTIDTNLVIYDDNKNMDSSRLYWTLKNYGHTGDILIVSGGLSALKSVKASVSKTPVNVTPSKYEVKNFNKDSIITMDVIASMIDNPEEGFKLIDVRSDEEFEAGTIPGAIHINHEDNLIDDYSFKSVKRIRSLYKMMGIMPEDQIAMFCKSSIRAANTYVSLYNAGYRNIKVYDGAWLEWSAEKMPVFKPEVKTPITTTTTQQDNS